MKMAFFPFLSPKRMIAQADRACESRVGSGVMAEPTEWRCLWVCFCVVTDEHTFSMALLLQFQISISYRSVSGPLQGRNFHLCPSSRVSSWEHTPTLKLGSQVPTTGPRDIWLFEGIFVREKMCKLDTNVYFPVRPQSSRRWGIIFEHLWPRWGRVKGGKRKTWKKEGLTKASAIQAESRHESLGNHSFCSAFRPRPPFSSDTPLGEQAKGQIPMNSVLFERSSVRYMPIIPTCEGLRQENYWFEAILNYTVSPMPA